MLKRPTRPLPRQFNRPLTRGTRAFVERRHKKTRAHTRERWKRWLMRSRASLLRQLVLLRKWMKPLLLGLAVLLVCLFLFSPILRVREIRVIRTEGRVDLAKVLDAVAPLYGKHLLFLSARDVTALVRPVVPDAATVTASKIYPSHLSIRITLAPLVARVRVETSVAGSLSAASGSVMSPSGSGAIAGPDRGDFLTENGLFVSAPLSSVSEPLPVIRIVDWSVRPVPGTRVLAPDFFDQMRRAERALTVEFGQQIRMRTVYLRAREFHLDGPVISYWFDARTPLDAALQRLRTFLKNVKITEVKSYIDLRLTGRVVYK